MTNLFTKTLQINARIYRSNTSIIPTIGFIFFQTSFRHFSQFTTIYTYSYTFHCVAQLLHTTLLLSCSNTECLDMQNCIWNVTKWRSAAFLNQVNLKYHNLNVFNNPIIKIASYKSHFSFENIIIIFYVWFYTYVLNRRLIWKVGNFSFTDMHILLLDVPSTYLVNLVHNKTLKFIILSNCVIPRQNMLYFNYITIPIAYKIKFM